jgi:hypothetical protein
MKMENHSGMMLTGKLLIHPPELSGNPTSRVIWKKQEERVKEMINLFL